MRTNSIMTNAMQRAMLVFLLVALSCPKVMAQDWAKKSLEKSSRHLEWVSVKHDKRTLKCFVAYPEVKTKAPVVLLIHEIFGLSDWVRSVADQLAAEGYIVVAPDLLSGMGAKGGDSDEFENQDAARKAVSGLPQEQVDADLASALKYASALPSAERKVAIAGFCWGGGQTFRFANTSKSPLVKAAFVFYGPGPKADSDASNITAPVYGFYAEKDERIGATLPETEAIMKKLGKTFQPVTYKDAGHGFMRTGQAPDANKADSAARDASWKRLSAQLHKL